jgi:uncharacterized cofD-like protein
LGGGHGLAATLTAARSLTTDITAIVTVADNGGSSGRLRSEFNFLPPGDLRMALAALCSSDEWGRDWADILQYRFTTSGDLDGHALGNLLLTALWDRDGDPVAGIDRVGQLLKIIGRVLPMAIEPLDIEARFNTSAGPKVVRGQVEVATAKGEIESLKLIPDSPKATPQALDAIAKAEWLTFGPGSWFSSVMPHFLLREQLAAIESSAAKKIIIFNLPEPLSADEFAGVSAAQHLELILSHSPHFQLDYAIVDPSALGEKSRLQQVVEGCGGKLVVSDVAKAVGSYHHSAEKLAMTFSHIFR